MNICAIDASTGEILDNPLICSNPSNCEGISTLQAEEFSWFPDKCEIDCVPPVTEAPVGQCNAGCVLEEECATETLSKIIYIQLPEITNSGPKFYWNLHDILKNCQIYQI